MRTFWLLLPLIAACQESAPAPAPTLLAAAAPAAKDAPARAHKSADAKTVLDVALESPDHSTLVAAVKASDLVNALDSPGGIYTVFAPTNDAFAALPAGTVDTLLLPENKAQLKAVVQHHATVPIVEQAELTDGLVLEMSDGTAVTVHVVDGRIDIDGAAILGEARARNGVVYVVDKVLVPPPK